MKARANRGRSPSVRLSRGAAVPIVLLAAALAAMTAGVRAQGPAFRAIAPLRDLPNLIYNGSFEYGDWWNADQPEYWAARANMRRDSRIVRDGRWSLRVDGPSESYTYLGLTLRPGYTYKLSGWIKTLGGSNCEAFFYYGQDGEPMHGSDRARGKSDWKKSDLTFTLPAKNQAAGMLRLQWKLAQGETAWFDGISATQAIVALDTVPPPSFVTKPGAYQGPLNIELKSNLPGATIYYTSDGDPPTPFSVHYDLPFRLHGSALVRARAFHAGYKDSPVAEGVFILKPRLGPGVPFNPVGWNQAPPTWWAQHIYNPSASNAFKGPVESPEPRINVADVRAKHPETTTAGIAEALALLPLNGGTLYFPSNCGPYVVTEPGHQGTNYYSFGGALLVTRRSNLHFISDGGVIQCDGSVFGFSSLQYPQDKTLQNPITNFYFKGLTFDGKGKSTCGMIFRHVCDILFDDCRWVNYARATEHHPGIVAATSMSDNIWMRRCELQGGMWGVYYDGVHNVGFIGCTFKGQRNGHLLMMTNNDMVHFSAAQRSSQYIVLAGNRFMGDGDCRDGFVGACANLLVIGNEFSGPYAGGAVNVTGRGMSNMRKYVRYDSGGIFIINNRIRAANTALLINGESAQWTRWGAYRMQSVIRGNDVEGARQILALRPEAQYDQPLYIRNILVTANRFSGSPGIELAASSPRAFSNILITANTFEGSKPPAVVDSRGKPLNNSPVVVEGNRLNAKP